MENRLNLKHKFGQGISPRAFMDGMQVRVMPLNNIPDTKERFASIYEKFAWQDAADREFLAGIGERSGLRCLILCTDWCPDVIWNVPVLLRILEDSRIPTEILPMEEHLETMEHFLTNGGRAQPIAVFLDANGDVLGKWGARPAYIQAVMDRFKAEHPDNQAPGYQDLLNETYREIGQLYQAGTEYQEVMLRELRGLFTSF